MNSRVLDVVRLKYPCKKSENWSLPCAISSPRSITAKRIFQILDDWFPSEKIRIRIDFAQLSSALLFESIDMNKIKTSEKLRISMKKHNLRFGNGQNDGQNFEYRLSWSLRSFWEWGRSAAKPLWMFQSHSTKSSLQSIFVNDQSRSCLERFQINRHETAYQLQCEINLEANAI